MNQLSLLLSNTFKISIFSLGHPAYPLLFDPQTSGGLLAEVEAEVADACISALKIAGYKDTTVIGHINSNDCQGGPLILLEL